MHGSTICVLVYSRAVSFACPGVGYWKVIATAVIICLTMLIFLKYFRKILYRRNAADSAVSGKVFCEVLDSGDSSGASAPYGTSGISSASMTGTFSLRDTNFESTMVNEALQAITTLVKRRGGAVTAVSTRREFPLSSSSGAAVTKQPKVHARGNSDDLKVSGDDSGDDDFSFQKQSRVCYELPAKANQKITIIEMNCLMDPNAISSDIASVLEKYPQIRKLFVQAKDVREDIGDGN